MMTPRIGLMLAAMGLYLGYLGYASFLTVKTLDRLPVKELRKCMDLYTEKDIANAYDYTFNLCVNGDFESVHGPGYCKIIAEQVATGRKERNDIYLDKCRKKARKNPQ